MEDYEADDLIATAVTQSLQKNFIVDIISSDHDLLQMITSKTSLFLLNSSISKIKKITNENFIEKFKIRPNQIIDYKAMAGDKSDDIPGITNVGPKTAIKLLSEYDSLDKIYAKIKKLPLPLQQKLQAQKKDVMMFKKIIQLVPNLPIKIDFSELKIDFFNKKCVDFYKKYNFKSLMSNNRTTSKHSQIQKKFFS